MRRYYQVVLALIFLLSLSSCKSEKEKAIDNFEVYFAEFHEAYPADKGTYSFKEYSDLQEILEGENVIGYRQTVTAVRKDPSGEVSENTLSIRYNTDFEVEYF